MADAGDQLWRFSLAFYERPGVAEALIALQDQCGLDVNLILFAVWHGLSGRGRLGEAALRAADRAAAELRSDVIEPLRGLRRHLRSDPADDVQQLRARIKELEIAAEKMAQFRLAATAPPPHGKGEPEQRLADAFANLACYAGPQAETSAIRQAMQRFVVNC